MRWILARTSRRRPTLMHLIDTERYGFGRCGVDMTYWTRVHFENAIPELQCMKCKKIDDKESGR